MIVDTNVIISALDTFAVDHAIARQAIALADADRMLVANEITFSELSGRYENAEAVEQALSSLGINIARLSLADCHRAGVAFRAYRRAGGERTSILPDFLIGAHAEGMGWPILTNDRKGFSSYFPNVSLIAPESFKPESVDNV